MKVSGNGTTILHRYETGLSSELADLWSRIADLALAAAALSSLRKACGQDLGIVSGATLYCTAAIFYRCCFSSGVRSKLNAADLTARLDNDTREPRLEGAWHRSSGTLAYYVEWHLRQLLAPLLFQDDDPAAGAQRRTSAVAPAQRSEAAEQKAHTKKTATGQRVHGFRDLLGALSSLTRNQVTTAAAPGLPFVTYTEPTPLQQEAFDLLGLSPKM